MASCYSSHSKKFLIDWLIDWLLHCACLCLPGRITKNFIVLHRCIKTFSLRLWITYILTLLGTIFRLKGSIAAISFLDCNGILIPAVTEPWQDVASREDKKATPPPPRQSNTSSFLLTVIFTRPTHHFGGPGRAVGRSVCSDGDFELNDLWPKYLARSLESPCSQNETYFFSSAFWWRIFSLHRMQSIDVGYSCACLDFAWSVCLSVSPHRSVTTARLASCKNGCTDTDTVCGLGWLAWTQTTTY